MLPNAMVLTLQFPARIYECHRTQLAGYTVKFRHSAGKSCRPEQKHVFETKPVLAAAECLKDLPFKHKTASTTAGALIAKVLPVPKASSRQN
jgi:hypothetical protein